MHIWFKSGRRPRTCPGLVSKVTTTRVLLYLVESWFVARDTCHFVFPMFLICLKSYKLWVTYFAFSLITLPTSVTRWQNYFEILGHLQLCKLAKWHRIFAKVETYFAKYQINTQKFGQSCEISPNLVTMLPTYTSKDSYLFEKASIELYFKRIQLILWTLTLHIFQIHIQYRCVVYFVSLTTI